MVPVTILISNRIKIGTFTQFINILFFISSASSFFSTIDNQLFRLHVGKSNFLCWWCLIRVHESSLPSRSSRQNFFRSFYDDLNVFDVNISEGESWRRHSRKGDCSQLWRPLMVLGCRNDLLSYFSGRSNRQTVTSLFGTSSPSLGTKGFGSDIRCHFKCSSLVHKTNGVLT